MTKRKTSRGRSRVKMTFKQAYTHEPFPIPINQMFGLGCCDCGLVHHVVWSPRSKRIMWMTVARANTHTAKRRKLKRYRGLQLPYSKRKKKTV